MARRPRVLLDCDGILVDFITPTLDVLYEVTGRRFEHDEVKEWDMMQSLGISKEVENVVFDRMKVEGVCLSMPLYHGAQFGVSGLRRICDLYICTSPFGGPFWTHEREEVLYKSFGIERSRVLHVRDKFVCAGDVLVEDKTSTLVKWREHHAGGLPIRWNKQYNFHDDWDGLNTSDWGVLFGMVSGFAAAQGLDARVSRP